MPLIFRRARPKAPISITRLMSILGAVVASLVAVALPALYYTISMREARHALAVETLFAARTIEGIIQARPDMWEFEDARMLEILSQPANDGKMDQREIRNAAGERIAATEYESMRPAIAASVTLFDSGRAVGAVVARHSVRTELFTTVILGAFSSLLGCVIYFVFRIFPIRKLKNTLTDLNAERDNLRRSERRFQDVAANSGEWIWELDAEGRFTYSSPDVEHILGYAPAETLGKHMLDLIHPDGRQKAAEKLAGVLTRGESVHNTSDMGMHKDGHAVILETSGLAVLGPDGKVTGCRAVSRDVTDRERAERLLRDSHGQLIEQQRILTSLTQSEFFAGNDLNRVVQRLMETDSRQLGIARVSVWRFTEDRSAIRCMDLYELKEDRHSAGTELKATDYPGYFSALEQGEAIVADDARTHPATREFLAGYLTPLGITSMLDVPLVFNGKLEGVICHEHIGPPISWTPEQRYFAVVVSHLIELAVEQDERRRAKEALAEAEKRLRTIFDNLADGMLIADLDSKQLCDCNPAICRMLGYTPKEILAIGMADIHPEKDLPFVAEQFERQAAGEFTLARELPMKRKDGSVFYADVNAVRVTLAGRACLIGLFRDTTDQRRAQKKLTRFAADLEQANEEVKQFAYIVSHDLRAPLVNLKGFSAEVRSSLGELASKLDAARSHLPEEEATAISKIVREDIPDSLAFIDSSSTNMDRLVTALLTLSRLGRTELNFEPLDMDALVAGVLKGVAHQMGERGAQASVGALPGVVADRTAMERVMGNILTNAVNYLETGRPGKIEVFGERGETETTFAIRDNGRGIAQEDMPKVFAPFRRAGKQNVPGEGIGLAYVQTLIRRHKGQIRCESELGVGTTFTFSIPHNLEPGDSHERAVV